MASGREKTAGRCGETWPSVRRKKRSQTKRWNDWNASSLGLHILKSSLLNVFLMLFGYMKQSHVQIWSDGCGFVFTAVVQATDGELPDVVYCRLFFVSLHASDSSNHSAELPVSWITGQISCCMISMIWYQLDTAPKICSIHNNYALLQNNKFLVIVCPRQETTLHEELHSC